MESVTTPKEMIRSNDGVQLVTFFKRFAHHRTSFLLPTHESLGRGSLPLSSETTPEMVPQPTDSTVDSAVGPSILPRRQGPPRSFGCCFALHIAYHEAWEFAESLVNDVATSRLPNVRR